VLAVIKIFAAIAICIAVTSGCSSETAPSEMPHLITTPRSDANYVWMLAKTTGQLTVVDGCVAIQTANSRPKTLVFAPDYSVEWIDGKWLIRDSFGGTVGSVGEQLEIGGGETPKLNFSDSSGCRSPFWLVTPKDRREWVPPGVKAPPVPE
jgi:hypothetical protein